MQFTKEFKARIRSGDVTVSFRRWKRPGARVGGRYNLHPTGAIEVLELGTLKAGAISRADARRAGFEDRASLLAFLDVDEDAEVTRVAFRYLGDALVKQPRRDQLDAAELTVLAAKLDAMDARSTKPWTRAVLTAISEHPGGRAADLATSFPDWDTPRFKSQVRKLKAQGLTESLETGYRLTARGRQLLADPGASSS